MFFGFHRWEEPESFADEMTRSCRVCGKVEYMYMGHWVPVPKKRVKYFDGEKPKVILTYRFLLWTVILAAIEGLVFFLLKFWLLVIATYHLR